MSPVVSNAVRAASRFRPIRTWLAVAALPLTAAVTLAMAPAQGAGAKPAAQSKPAAAPAAQSAGSGELFRVDDVHSLALFRVPYLSNQFKQETGLTPSAFKNQTIASRKDLDTV